jgi:hypothetical protein
MSIWYVTLAIMCEMVAFGLVNTILSSQSHQYVAKFSKIRKLKMIYERHCSKLCVASRAQCNAGHTIQQGDVPLGHNLLLSGHFLTASVHYFEVLRTFFLLLLQSRHPLYALVQMCAINRIT